MAEGSEKYKVELDIQALQKQVLDVLRTMEQLGTSVVKQGEAMDGALKKVGMAVGGYFTYAQVQQFTSEIINARKEIEKYEISFRTLLGDAKLSSQFFGELKKFAVQTPLLLGDLAKGAQTMLGFNIEAEKVIPTLKQIGDISMGNKDAFGSLTLAFSQMSATGKLMGQDLLQMINAGFNPLAEISRTTGKSLTELKDDMSAGKISAEMVAKAFETATSAGGKFNGMLEAQSKSIEGSISNLEGAFQDLLNTIGTELQPVITGSIGLLTDLAKSYETIGRIILGLIATYGTYKAAMIANTAIEAVHVLGLKDSIKYLLLNIKATKAATVAQAALNAVMKANPYVLIATTVVAAAAAIWTLTDRTSSAERATKRLQEREEEHKNTLDELIDVATDESKTAKEREDAVKRLQQLYPGLIKKEETYIDVTRRKTEELEKFNDAKREELRLMGETDLQNDKEFLKTLDKIRDLYSKGDTYGAQAVYNAMTDAQKKEFDKNKGSGRSLYQQATSVRDVIAKGINSKDADKQAKSQADYLDNIKSKSDDVLKSDLSRYKENIKALDKQKKGYIAINGVLVSKENLEKRISAIQEEQSAREKKSNPYNDAQKELADLRKKQKDLQAKARTNLTDREKAELDKELKETEEAIKKAKEKYIQYGGQTDKDTRDANKTKNERLKRQQEMHDLDEQIQQEQERNAIDREYELEQIEIDAMKDGTAKTIAQIRLDANKKREAIIREEQDLKAAREKVARELWELNNAEDIEKNGTTWLSSGAQKAWRDNYTLTDEDKTYFNNKYKGVTEQEERDGEEVNDALVQHMNEYLKIYGTFQERKEAIQKEYAKKIADAEGDEGLIKTLQAQMATELEELNQLFGKSASAFADLFADASTKSVHSIQAIIDKYRALLDFLQGGGMTGEAMTGHTATKYTLEDMKALGFSEEDIKKIQADPEKFKAVADQFQRLKDILSDKSPFQGITDNIKSAIGQFKKGESSFGDMATTVVDGLTKMLPMFKNMGESIATIFGADTSDGSAFGKAFGTAESVLQAGQGAAKIASGDIVGGLMDGLSAIANLSEIWASSNVEEMRKDIQRLETSNKNLDASIDRLTQELMNEGAVKAAEKVQEILDKQEERLRNTQRAMTDVARTHGDKDHSLNTYFNEQYANLIDKVNKKLGTSFASLNDILGNATSEQWRELQDSGVLAQIENALQTIHDKKGGTGDVDQLIGYIDEMIGMEGKAEELKDTIQEAFAGVTLEQFRDDFKSMLQDLDSSVDDFTDDFQAKINNAIIGLVAEGFNDDLKAVYDQMAQAIQEGNYEELKKLKQQVKDIAEQAKARVDALEAEGVVESIDTGQAGATTSQAMSVTEETAQDIVGRMTALQISNELANNAITSGFAQMQEIGMQSLGYQAAIAQNTGELYAMNARLGNILDQMALQGENWENAGVYAQKTYAEMLPVLTSIRDKVETGL